MAPKVTSSGNRSSRKPSKPPVVTSSKGRGNRSSVSTARVSTGSNGKPKAGGARVTNSSQRTNTGSSRPTGGSRPALPPGNRGGAVTKPSSNKPTPPRPNSGPVQPVRVREVGKPQLSGSSSRPALGAGNAPNPNARRQAAETKLNQAAAGSQGPNRVGQPAGSANRVYGANRVNAAVARAQQSAGMRRGLANGSVATAIVGALLNTPAELRKAVNLVKDPKGTIQRATNETLSGDPSQSVLNPKPKPRQGNYQTRFPNARAEAANRVSQIKAKVTAPAATPAASRSSSGGNSGGGSSRSSSAAPSRSTAPKPPASAPKPPNVAKVETETTDAPKPPTTEATSTKKESLKISSGRRPVGRDEMIEYNMRRRKKQG
jgi:hypothetical protein